MQVPGSQLVAAVAVWWLTSGCCTSMRRGAEIDTELRQQNIARAEPAMRSAAQRQGATLLPHRPQGLWFTPFCAVTPDAVLRTHPYCVLQPSGLISVTGGLGDVYQLRDQQGKRRIAITIGEELRGARLAMRDKTLFLLTPAVTYHPIDRRARCQCAGGPELVSMSGYVNLGVAFVIDDAPNAAIEPITVPVVDDYVAWDCKMILVRNDHAPRPAVAYANPRLYASSNHCFGSR